MQTLFLYQQFWIQTGLKTLKETCFCQSGRNPGRNLFLPGWFKPVLAETCQRNLARKYRVARKKRQEIWR